MERSAAVIALVSVMAVTACSRAAAPPPPASVQEPTKAAAAPKAGSPALAAPEIGHIDRKVIRTADLGLLCSDPSGAAARIWYR